MKDKSVKYLLNQVDAEAQKIQAIKQESIEAGKNFSLKVKNLENEALKFISESQEKSFTEKIFSNWLAIHLSHGGSISYAMALVRLLYGSLGSQSTTELTGKNILFDSHFNINARSEAYLKKIQSAIKLIKN